MAEQDKNGEGAMPCVTRAAELFLEGRNCSQSVFAAYAEHFGIGFETALKLSAPLGGGVGRMRNVCGAFSALAMLLGLKEASASADAEAKKRIYARTQALAKKFAEENGSIICAELLRGTGADSSASPQKRDKSYYASRPCLKIVESAARLAESDILHG